MKTDVEIIERTKEEDIVRFQSQKITFSFDMIVHIKEAMVGLSSRSLTLALKVSVFFTKINFYGYVFLNLT